MRDFPSNPMQAFEMKEYVDMKTQKSLFYMYIFVLVLLGLI